MVGWVRCCRGRPPLPGAALHGSPYPSVHCSRVLCCSVILAPLPVCPTRVVEHIGMVHDEGCQPGCTQRHAWFYVRVRATSSSAPPSRHAARRLDLVVDLQDRLR